MPRLLIACSVLLLSMSALGAEDLFGDGAENGQRGGGLENVREGHESHEAEQTGGEAEPGRDEAAQTVEKRWVNTGFLRLVHAYAEQKGLKIQSYGTGQVRVASIGGGQLGDPKDLVSKGELALKGLDSWTGSQGWFFDPDAPADEVIHLFVIADKHFDGLVDFARKNGVQKPDGEDLVKKLKTFHGPRCSVLPSKKWHAHPIMPAHWAVNLSAALALKAWFAGQPGEPEPWLTEGLKAELERVITDDGVPRITTIAYESNDPDTKGSGNWAADVANLIKNRDPALLKASMVMSLDLVGMSGANYKQMWSFCQYVRGLGGNRKGSKNKFAQIMQIIADGKTGMMACEEVLKKDDKSLTRGWVSWAVQQR